MDKKEFELPLIKGRCLRFAVLMAMDGEESGDDNDSP